MKNLRKFRSGLVSGFIGSASCAFIIWWFMDVHWIMTLIFVILALYFANEFRLTLDQRVIHKVKVTHKNLSIRYTDVRYTPNKNIYEIKNQQGHFCKMDELYVKVLLKAFSSPKIRGQRKEEWVYDMDCSKIQE